MLSTTLFFLLLCSPTMSLTLGQDVPQPILKNGRTRWLWQRASSSTRNVPAAGYYPPPAAGGSMLTEVPDTWPVGQGEPINVIISGNSDARVLVNAETDGGLQNYFTSFGFSGECLGQHSGSDQAANLGDGNGFKNETAVMRWNYGDPQLGTCTETIQGGNHFRYWIQDGLDGNSGAIFMATSYEKPIAQQHDIVINGYNNGRDWLVGNISSSAVVPTNTTTLSGNTSFGGYTYQTNIQYISGLAMNTSIGVNHNETVLTNTTNAVDGLVAVLDVKIVAVPATATSASELISVPRFSWLLAVLLPFLAFS